MILVNIINERDVEIVQKITSFGYNIDEEQYIRDRTDFLHTLTGSVAEKVFRRSPVTIVSFRDEKNAAYLRKRLEG